jgi:hypothetical protein
MQSNFACDCNFTTHGQILQALSNFSLQGNFAIIIKITPYRVILQLYSEQSNFATFCEIAEF